MHRSTPPLRYVRAILLLFALLVDGTVVHADDGTGVIVSGDPALQPQLAAQLEGWLRDHGHTIVDAPMPADAINTMINCFALDDGGLSCASGVVAQRSSAASLVLAKADVATLGDGMRTITLTGYWFPKDGDATSRQRVCERCTDQLLTTATDALITELAKSQQRGTGRLRVSSVPAGATVLVDNDAVGVTPLDYDLVPGNHQVTIKLDRREVETRPAAIRAGETTTIDVPLEVARDAGGTHVRLAPLAVGLVGVAALTTGIVWIAIDEDESPSGPLYIRDTAPQGYVTAGVGLAAVAVGAWLWFRHPSSNASSGPIATVTPGTAYIGWSARF